MWHKLIPFFTHQQLALRLLAGTVALIMLTTLSVGVPIYWQLQQQLEVQSWSFVETAVQTTQTFLASEQLQLANASILLAERPTLHRLLRDKNWAELPTYLQTFQEQTSFDFLLICDPAGQKVVESELFLNCNFPANHYLLLDNAPALVHREPIVEPESGQELGQLVTGIWLDHSYLTQLAEKTRLAQSILLLPEANHILSSSFSGRPGRVIQSEEPRVLQVNGATYYTALFPLPNPATPLFWVEVAYPVTAVLEAQNRALSIWVVSTAVVISSGAILATWYIRHLTRPLAQLTAVAHQISGGNFSASIPLFADPPEVTTLALALQQSQESMNKALQERSQARDWLNTLIQSIVEGVITLDQTGRVTFFSYGAEQILGWRAAEAQGQPINQLITMANPAELFSELIPTSGHRTHLPILTRTGKAVTISVTSGQLLATSDNLALVLRDVTEEEATQRLHSYFLANMTHEFRTPLSSLTASLELLMDEADNLTAAEIRELLRPTWLSLLSLQTLIDNLLESSQVEAGRFTLRLRPGHLHEMLPQALRIVRPLLERRQQSLVITEPSPLPLVLADQARVVQVLVNLLTNASKYSALGQQIELKVVVLEAELRVEIADYGPGIPPAEQTAIFRRFVRLEAGEKEQYGIGLGLHLVKTTIEAHHGRVGVENRPGGGAIFWFTLPLALS